MLTAIALAVVGAGAGGYYAFRGHETLRTTPGGVADPGAGASGLPTNPDGTFAEGKLKLNVTVKQTTPLRGRPVAMNFEAGVVAVYSSGPEGAGIVLSGRPAPAELPRHQGIEPGQVSISRDGKHWAYVADASRDGSKTMVVRDGVADPECGYVRGPVVYSADSNHSAYVGTVAPNKCVLVLDGVQKPLPLGVVRAVFLSDDGSHVAVVGEVQPSDNIRWGDRPYGAVWVDGSMWPDRYLNIQGGKFSPDGKRFVVVAKQNWNSELVVENGVAGKTYDQVNEGDHYQTLGFSPDSSKLVYAARRGDKVYLVVNGEETGAYSEILGPITFSPDSRRQAFVGFTGSGGGYVYRSKGSTTRPVGMPALIIDGTDVGPGFGPVFSGDSQHVAYLRHEKPTTSAPFGRAERLELVVDQKWTTTATGPAHVQFSPDGKHIAFVESGEWPEHVQTLVFDRVRLRYPLRGKIEHLAWTGGDTLIASTMDEGGGELRRVEVTIAPVEPAAGSAPAVASGPASSDPGLLRKLEQIRLYAEAAKDARMRQIILRDASLAAHISAGDLKGALALAPANPMERIRVFVRVAEHQQGNVAGATLELALAEARSIENVRLPENAEVGISLAVGFARAGRSAKIGEALALAPDADVFQMARFRGQLVDVLIARPNFVEAAMAAGAMSDPRQRGAAAMKLAQAAKAAGDKASAIAAALVAAKAQVPERVSLGALLLELGQTARATEVLSEGENYDAGHELVPVVRRLHGEGKTELARSLANAGRPKWKASTRPDDTMRFAILAQAAVQLARVQIEMGDRAGAIETLRGAANAAVETKGQPLMRPFDGIYLEIAERLAEAGATSEAKSMLKKLAGEGGTPPRGMAPSGEAIAVCRGLARIGALDEALAMYQASPDSFVSALPDIAAAQYRKGEKKEAAANFERAAEFIRKSRNPGYGMITVGEVAAIRAQAGDLAGALTMVEAEPPGTSFEGTVRLVEAFVNADDLAGAQVVITRSGGGHTGLIELAVAKKRLAAGDVDSALDSLDKIRRPPFETPRAEALMRLAREGRVEVVVKHLQAQDLPRIVSLAAVRSGAGDKGGARQILDRGVEIALANLDVSNEATWAIINGLADAGGTESAIAIADTYAAATAGRRPRDPYAGGVVSGPEQLARLKARFNDAAGAIAALRGLSNASGFDQELFILAGMTADPSLGQAAERGARIGPVGIPTSGPAGEW